MPAFRDITGQRFGKWKVLQKSEHRKGNRVYWDCKCDCGTLIPVTSGSLLQGKSKACGTPQCYGPQGEQGMRTAIRYYRKAAKDRGYVWTLSDDEARVLLLGKCTYCSAAPRNRIGLKPNYAEASNKYHSVLTNGIDRVDNELGYVSGNCVSCCSKCNYGKHNHTLEEFKAWVAAAYATMFMQSTTEQL